MKHFFTNTVLIFFLAGISINAQKKNDILLPVRLGFSSFVFQETKPQDANAAITLWAGVLENNLYREHSIKAKLIPSLLTSSESIENALTKKEIDMIVISAPDFYNLRDKYHLVPAIAGVIDDNIYEQYILLVRKDSGFNNLQNLYGKVLALPKDSYNPLLNIWLTNSLTALHEKDRDYFFGKIKNEEKESNSVYQVFFKKADCAIVRKRLYSTMCALNPQLEKSIKIIQTSSDLVLSFAAYRKEADTTLVKLFFDVAKNAHTTQEGKNILNVFKSVRLIDLNAKDLESTLKMVDIYVKSRKQNKK